MSDFLPNVPNAAAGNAPVNDVVAIPDAWFDEKPAYDLLPPAEYIVKVSGREVFQKAGSDKVQFKWTLTVVEGEFVGKNITHFTTVGVRDAAGNMHDTPDKWRYTALLTALGATPTTMPEYKTERGFAVPTEALLNRMVRVQVVHNQYNGNTYANVRKVFPVDPVGKLFEGTMPQAAGGLPTF